MISVFVLLMSTDSNIELKISIAAPHHTVGSIPSYHTSQDLFLDGPAVMTTSQDEMRCDIRGTPKREEPFVTFNVEQGKENRQYELQQNERFACMHTTKLDSAWGGVF